MVAIFYHPDGYETNRENLMGRHAAGEGMLKALCRYGSSENLEAYCVEKKHFDQFVEKVKLFSPGRKTCKWIHPANWQSLKESGSIFMSGPVVSNLAWLRRHGNQKDFSLCGITHTTATDRAMDAIAELVTVPVQPWDALVCTSHSVRTMVATVIQNYQEYLADRLGTKPADKLPLELPVIPLGVDCAAFDYADEKKAELRRQMRELLKMSPDELAVLYVGRLSFHDKAHPLPLYLALEDCAQKLKKPITLIMAGWFASDAIKKNFMEGAKAYCPSVKVIFVDGRKGVAKNNIWFAADVFTSLVDNVQETFGLTPIEAMAAGLPVVVSDWDGYKETVQDGVEGYRIPTWTAPAGLGAGLALAYATGAEHYANYVGYQSQYTSVDITSASGAFLRLLSDEALRKQMGAAGRERAKTVFDWSLVIKQYEALWAHQAELRGSTEVAARIGHKPANPLRDDPFSIFANYPTNTLSPDTVVARMPGMDREKVQKLGAVPMNTFGIKLAYPPGKIAGLLEALPEGAGVKVDTICKQVPASDGPALLFTLLWLSKIGLVRLIPAEAIEKLKEAKAVAASSGK